MPKETVTQSIVFIPAAGAHYAVYGKKDDKHKLLCVVAWGLDATAPTTPAAFVAKPYTDELVRASSIDDFVTIIGPNAQSDQRAQATRMITEAEDYRRAYKAQDVISRRRRRATI